MTPTPNSYTGPQTVHDAPSIERAMDVVEYAEDVMEHAYNEYVRGRRGRWGEIRKALGVDSKAELADFVVEVIETGRYRELNFGRRGYWADIHGVGTGVMINPRGLSIVYVTSEEAFEDER